MSVRCAVTSEWQQQQHLCFSLPEVVRLAAAGSNSPDVAGVSVVVIAKRAYLQTKPNLVSRQEERSITTLCHSADCTH